MSMATLDFCQNEVIPKISHTHDTVLFGDFSEVEVATIINNSTLFRSDETLVFGTFTADEINDIIDASHLQKEFVDFDFEDIVAAKTVELTETNPEVELFHVKPTKSGNVVGETDLTAKNATKIASPPPPPPPPSIPQLAFGATSVVPQNGNINLSTPERTDIDEVLKILIEETVKSSNFATTTSGPYPYSTQPPATWSNGTTQPSWTDVSKPTFNTDHFYSSSEVWSKPAPPTSVWSNGGGTQWSSLFKTEEKTLTEPPKNILPQILSENLPVSAKDHELMLLGSQLQLMTTSHHIPVHIIPRGLINKSTNCFAHAPLQALLVSPLYHVIQQIESSYVLSPVLKAVKEFFKSFTAATGVVDKMGTPFEPTFIFEMLRNKMPDFNENGRQEDAEELLGIVLSNLHDEMVSAIRAAGTMPRTRSPKKSVSLAGTMLSAVEDGEWQQIGRKNKVQVTRNTSNNEPSPVSELFGGITRSVVSKAGAKESATLQPFLSLQLNLQHQHIRSVKDALQHFTQKEQIILNDVKCFKRETLESLPPVLILHLKRFIFDETAKSCQKLMKEVDFEIDMTITDDMMSTIGTMARERRYHLFAVVYHHGSHATGGHYTAMVYHDYISCWVNADDDKMAHQDDKAVLKHINGRTPYLLFYKRIA